jgi:hypothetical protein
MRPEIYVQFCTALNLQLHNFATPAPARSIGRNLTIVTIAIAVVHRRRIIAHRIIGASVCVISNISNITIAAIATRRCVPADTAWHASMNAFSVCTQPLLSPNGCPILRTGLHIFSCPRRTCHYTNRDPWGASHYTQSAASHCTTYNACHVESCCSGRSGLCSTQI